MFNAEVSGPQLKEKVLYLADTLGSDNVPANSGWIYRLKMQHKIVRQNPDTGKI
jgi:hypothetical protein